VDALVVASVAWYSQLSLCPQLLIANLQAVIASTEEDAFPSSVIFVLSFYLLFFLSFFSGGYKGATPPYCLWQSRFYFLEEFNKYKREIASSLRSSQRQEKERG